MRTPVALLLVALTLTGCVFSVGGGHGQGDTPDGPYGLEVAIAPGESPGTWSCNAVVFELPSGRSILAPRMIGKVGERAEVTSTSGQLRFTVSVLVEDGGRAGWSAEVVREGRTMARQSGSVRL